MPVALSNHLAGVIESASVRQNLTPINYKCTLWSTWQWKAVLAELVSTLFLILLGCMSCIPTDENRRQPQLYGAFGFGLTVTFNVQAFGHISGAHMNPSVTVAALIWGKVSVGLGIAYIIAQCAGAVIGFGILLGLSPTDLKEDICNTQLYTQYTLWQAVSVEAILTAALNFLNCAVWDPVNKEFQHSNSLKFGFTIAALSLAGGSLTGASMNPARSFAPALWTGTWTSHWVYWVGPFLGGSVATIFYKYIWLYSEN